MSSLKGVAAVDDDVALASNRCDSRSTVLLGDLAAGTIIQTTRGFLSPQRSCSRDDVPPGTRSFTTRATASAFTSYTTHSWPPRIRRRTMFAAHASQTDHAHLH